MCYVYFIVVLFSSFSHYTRENGFGKDSAFSSNFMWRFLYFCLSLAELIVDLDFVWKSRLDWIQNPGQLRTLVPSNPFVALFLLIWFKPIKTSRRWEKFVCQFNFLATHLPRGDIEGVMGVILDPNPQ